MGFPCKKFGTGTLGAPLEDFRNLCLGDNDQRDNREAESVGDTDSRKDSTDKRINPFLLYWTNSAFTYVFNGTKII